MARQVTIEQVDAALDAIDDDSGVGRALADLITRHGEWDYGTAEAEGMTPELFKLYAWFLPLLRLDVTIKFVQQIKLTQELVGMGSARVRPPRLELVGEELAYTRSVIETAIAARPAL